MAMKKMKIRAWTAGDRVTVKAILFHPMETGQRKDKSTGETIPAHFITEVKCEHLQKNVLTCLWGPGVSKNPFISFKFKGARKGESVKISWVDNQGQSDSMTAAIG